MQEKTCTRCKQCLPADAFRTRTRYGRPGLVALCRKCETAYMADRHKQQKDGGRLIYVPDPLNIAAREWGRASVVHGIQKGQLKPLVRVEIPEAA
jgi:hypothetical protein